MFGYVNLPTQFEYWPPLVIKLLDVSQNYPKVSGATTITSLEKYMKKEISKEIKVHMIVKRKTALKENDELDLEAAPLLIVDTQKRITVFRRISKLFKNSEVKSSFVKNKQSEEAKNYNWWTKYYNSLDETRDDDVPNNKHRLVIYPSELESQKEFNRFQDWATTIPLYQGVDISQENPLKNHQHYCQLKASFEFQKLEGLEHFLTETRTSLVEQFSK